MKKHSSLITHLSTFMLLLLLTISNTGWGQTTIFSYTNTTTSYTNLGWTATNNIATNPIDQTSYLLLEAGNPGDRLTTGNYDLSSYSYVVLNVNVATFGTGSNPSLRVEISSASGSTFTALATTYTSATPTSSTYVTGGPIVIPAPSGGFTSTTKFRFSNTITSGRGLRIQSLNVVAPTQASSITFSSVSNSAFTLNWTDGSNGSAGRRAIFVAQTSTGNAAPVNGTTYTASTDWNTKGTQIGSTGWYCVYNNTGTHTAGVSLSNLSAGTTYRVMVCEYEGSGATSVFNLTTATNNPNNQATTSGCTAPTTQAATISLSSTNTTGSNYSFTRGDGTGGVIVVARATATAAVDPTSGTTYTPSATGSFSGTTTTGTGNIVIYSGTAAGASNATGNLSISNLSAGTQYTLTAYEFNTTGTCYNTTSPPSTNFRTLCIAPTTNTPSTVGSKSFTATWGSVTGASSYRLDVSAASDFSSFVSGYENLTVSGISQSVTGLNYNTQYHFRVRAINGDGAASANSNTSSTTTKTQATSLVLVSVPSTGSVATNLSTFTVEARRADASVDDAYTSNVSISKVSGAGAISGNGAVAAVAGVASFSSVQFSSADTYTISATDGTLTSTTSGNIVVSLPTYLWTNSSSGQAWLTTGNWSLSAVPGINDYAQFQGNPTGGGQVGINMNNPTNNGTGNQAVGAIEVSGTRTVPLTIGNSTSSRAGVLTLNGLTINSVNNTVLRNTTNQLFTIQQNISTATSGLTVALGNATDNIISIEGTGGIAISTPISGASRNLTKVGSGAGELTLSSNNSYSGNTTISAGTLALSGSGAIASSPQIIIGSGATFNVSGLTSALSLGASQSLRTAATGSNTTSTVMVASAKDLTLSAGGLFFTAYGGGATAPLTVTGSSAGALALNSSPVTVTTTAALAVGTYKLIVKGGSATGVSGTAGTLTIAGAGLTSDASAALSVLNGELILTVSSLSGITPPTLTAASSATVDNTFEVTFTDDENWRTSISAITVGGSTLSTSAYNTATAGKIIFDPSQDALLQSAGSKTIVISATTFNYNDATVTQSIAAGAAQNLSVSTQPVAPSSNGAVLATQPVVRIRDQYNNTLTGSSASVSAAVGSGTWTLGGTSSVNASSGVATFSGLTATSSNAVTGANITFTSGALSVTSSNFNIPGPTLGTYAFAGTTGTLAATGVASNVTFGNISLTGISQNGNSANAFSGSASWGSTFSSSSRYLEFTITANSGFLVTPTDFVMDVFRSGAGATNYAVRSSADSYAADLATGTVPTSATTISTISLSGASYTSLNSITFRIYGWGGSGSGDFRLDNIIVRGSVSAALTPPTLTAAGSATVDGAFNVTFTPDNSAWRSAITGITVGGTALGASAYTVSAGQIAFTPSASTLLQSSGSKSIAVLASGYSNATVSQTIGAGAATKLGITTQPVAPTSNGGSLATQPVIAIQDQYGNTTSSTATVVAAVGAGTWTIGGTTSRAGVSGTATFTNLTATSAAAVTGATISFSSTGLTGVVSNTFNLPAPPPANDLCASPTALTVGAAAVSGTTVNATYATLTNEPYEAFSDVWYSFTPSVTGTHTITVTNSAGVDYDVYAFISCPSSATGYVIGGNAAGSSTSSESLSFTATGGQAYLIRVANTTSTAGSTFNIAVSFLADQPSTIASGVALTSKTTNSLSLSWTNGNGANRIVVARLSTSSAVPPTDGTGYSVNSASFADGSNVTTGTGNVVVFNGSGNTLTVTGLSAATSYSFDVYEYNGSGSSANYAGAVSLTSQFTLSTEPTAHAASFTATTTSSTNINLAFSAASTLPASGYLLLRKSTAFVSADYPVDGNAYSVGATIGGATVNTVVTNNSTTSTTGTGVEADNTYFYLLVPFNWLGTNSATRNYYTGGTIPTASASTPSAVNDAVGISSSEAGTISSLTNTAAPLSSTTGSQVWQFTIRDGGSGLNDNDVLPTKISQIILTENASNTVASWSTSIRTVALFDGSTLLATGTVGNPTDNITFSGLSLTIPDGESKTLSVRLSLKTTLGATDDGKRFVFNLTNSNITTVADGTSSGFPSSGSINSAASSANVIEVAATKLAFVTQPSNVNITETMSPSVTVEAEDANGNRDLDYTTKIGIVSTGNLSNILSATPLSGLATFDNIVHTANATQTGRQLTASSGSLTSATSNTFNVNFVPVTIYEHNFSLASNQAPPYTTAPDVFDANLSSSSWTNNLSSSNNFTALAGSAGTSLSVGGSSPYTYTLTFNVTSGYQVSIASFDFWRQRSVTGPTNWSMTINGISVGSGSLSGTSGASIGQTNVTNTVSGQTSTITVVITLTGASGGTFRLDDFTLKGNVTCIAPTNKTVSAASTICVNTSTNVSVASSEVGVSYQLRNDADDSEIGSPVAGTGGTINLPTGDLASTTTFNVLATNSASGCGTTQLQLTNTPTITTATCYSVTYNANGATEGTVPAVATNILPGTSVTASANSGELIKDGFVFVGWNTFVNGLGADYAAGSGTLTMPSANVTLYAKWQSIQFASFRSNGAVNFTQKTNWQYNNGTSWVSAPQPPISTNNITLSHATTLNEDFIVASGATLTVSGLGSSLEISPGITLTIAGTANFGGRPVTLKSTAAGTAAIGQVTGTLSNASNVTVERYIGGGRRAWRLLTIPVTGVSIRDAWAGATANANAPTGESAGSGTLITGHGATYTTGAAAAATGFDWFSGLSNQSFSSIRFYANDNWISASNTPDIRNGPEKQGYMLFVRGDRTKTWFGNANTTLRPTGTMKSGTQNILVDSTYVVVGNPYPSPIDLNAVYNNTGNSAKITRNFWIWDATLGNFGGFRALSWNGNSYDMTGGSGSASDYIKVQSAQAFFVEKNGAGGSIAIEENDKVSSSGYTLRPTSPSIIKGSIAKININLHEATGENLLVDGAAVRFNNNYKQAANETYDAIKFNSFNENLSIVRNNRNLSIESRPLPAEKDSVYLSFWNLGVRSYTMRINTSDWESKMGSAVLIDRMTNKSTPIDMSGGYTDYTFSVSNAAQGRSADRFVIVFKDIPTQQQAPVRFTKLNAEKKEAAVEVKWEASEVEGINSFEVERSADGMSFTKVNSVEVVNVTGTQQFTVLDNQPINGWNYYRIRNVEANGKVSFSNIAKVQWLRDAQIRIYPNVIANGKINLLLQDQQSGRYQVVLTTLSGQRVYSHLLQHAEGTSSYSLELKGKKRLSGGEYILTVYSNNEIKQTEKVVIQ